MNLGVGSSSKLGRYVSVNCCWCSCAQLLAQRLLKINTSPHVTLDRIVQV